VDIVAEPTAVKRQEAYADLARSDDFKELRRRYRAFAFPWTIAFLAWYLLFVICANWAPGLMNATLFGNINVALVFGLLQFVSTFVIAGLYGRHARSQLDPEAGRLAARYGKAVDR
jgi:uncharacterized membrane protein (DUF485 family)